MNSISSYPTHASGNAYHYVYYRVTIAASTTIVDTLRSLARGQRFVYSAGMISKSVLAKYAAITLPLLIGIAIRLTGIEHGKPDMVYHPDVAKQTLVARHVYHGNLDIRQVFNDDFQRTLYPYGTSVILGNIAKLGGNHMDDVHRWQWALRMRYLSVSLITLATLVLLIVISRRLKPLPVFLTGLVVLAEPINAQFSHYGMNDVPLLAFIILSLSFSMLMPEEKKIPYWSLLCGLVAGAGFAVKYQGLLALTFPGICWLMLLRRRTARLTCFSAAAVAFGFFVGFLPLSPLLTKDPGYFFKSFSEFMAWQANIMGVETPLALKLRTNLLAFGEILCTRGFILIIPIAVLGCIHAWKHRKDSAYIAPIISCMLLTAVLLLAILGSRDIVRQNDMIPISALLIIPGGLMCGGMQGKSQKAVLAMIGALAVFFLSVSTLDAFALRREDTRLLARDWCDGNLSTPVTVAFEMYTLPPSLEGAKAIRCKFLGDETSRHLLIDHKAEVCIASSLAYERFFDRGSPYYDVTTQEAYDMLQSDYEVLKEFSDRPLLYAQPKITIYKLKGAKSD